MTKKFVCDRCGGMTIEGQDDDELVRKVQEHAQERHAESPSREEVLGWAQAA